VIWELKRGGFGPEEMDIYFPGWREEVSELSQLAKRAESAKHERDAIAACYDDATVRIAELEASQARLAALAENYRAQLTAEQSRGNDCNMEWSDRLNVSEAKVERLREALLAFAKETENPALALVARDVLGTSADDKKRTALSPEEWKARARRESEGEVGCGVPDPMAAEPERCEICGERKSNAVHVGEHEFRPAVPVASEPALCEGCGHAELHHNSRWRTDDARVNGTAADAPGSARPRRGRSRTVGDRAKGLYRKFHVYRDDGRDGSGEKHDGCEYFVLDLTHDPFAWFALRRYAEACRETHPKLSADLHLKIDAHKSWLRKMDESAYGLANKKKESPR